jgi:HlyD family secretion protein
MKLTRTQLYLSALAVLVLAFAGYWILMPRESEVATIRAEVGPASRVLAVNGRIRPRLQVDIRPTLAGDLVALPFDVGDRVAAGQILARIDDAPETAAIAEAQASAQAQQATVAQARRDLARFVALG